MRSMELKATPPRQGRQDATYSALLVAATAERADVCAGIISGGRETLAVKFTKQVSSRLFVK